MPPSAPARLLYTLVFSATVFLSVALPVLLQPVLGKLLLPRLSGHPTAVLALVTFFTAVGLAGLVYAHVTVRLLGARRQALVHSLTLLLPAVLWGMGLAGVVGGVLPHGLRVSPAAAGEPSLPGVVALLAPTVGLPVFLLGAAVPRCRCCCAGSPRPATPTDATLISCTPSPRSVA